MSAIPTLVKQRILEREGSLSKYSSKSSESIGRQEQEEPCPLRTEFQRDRDRIIHSKSFRRLKHKTQVFIAPSGDHYVTRLTHTLEVAQIARTITRSLNLNEDLAEAISLGHDIGHTPFGHIGEDEMNKLNPGGFRHAEQSLRLIEKLEKEGHGLNLTWEVRHGIVSHSKPRGDFLDGKFADGLTLEGQICRISDAVAYLNHDLADSFRAGLLVEDDLPSMVKYVLGTKHSERVGTMVRDIVESSWECSGTDTPPNTSSPKITMSPKVRDAVNVLREFMFENVYIPEDNSEQGAASRYIVRLLYSYYEENLDLIPEEYLGHGRPVTDYVAGMTDLYAMRAANKIEPAVADTIYKALMQ